MQTNMGLVNYFGMPSQAERQISAETRLYLQQFRFRGKAIEHLTREELMEALGQALDKILSLERQTAFHAVKSMWEVQNRSGWPY